MIQIEFTPEELDALHFERYHHPEPKVQKRMEAVYLKGFGLEPGEICRICRITEPTLVSYLKRYQEGGIEALKHFEYAGQPSELNQHGASLESYFREHPPRSVAEAQSAIQKKRGSHAHRAKSKPF